ncbi:hypothetical protein U1Q18_040727 [Sarracenia purpurea var. burkii]
MQKSRGSRVHIEFSLGKDCGVLVPFCLGLHSLDFTIIMERTRFPLRSRSGNREEGETNPCFERGFSVGLLGRRFEDGLLGFFNVADSDFPIKKASGS